MHMYGAYLATTLLLAFCIQPNRTKDNRTGPAGLGFQVNTNSGVRSAGRWVSMIMTMTLQYRKFQAFVAMLTSKITKK
jgi:hypothetical protein